VLSDAAARAEYDRFRTNGIPFMERYYNRYAHRYGAPKLSLKVVLGSLVAIISLLQYLYHSNRYEIAREVLDGPLRISPHYLRFD